MISGALVGDRALVARLGRVSQAMKDEVDATVQELGFELERRVAVEQLTGQVLHVRTGRLRASIAHGNAGSVSRQETTADTSIYYVGTNVSYGVAWERGIRARDIVPVRAKALRFELNGEIVFRKRVHVPAQAPRQFLEPALDSMRDLITDQLGQALYRGATKALNA